MAGADKFGNVFVVSMLLSQISDYFQTDRKCSVTVVLWKGS